MCVRCSCCVPPRLCCIAPVLAAKLLPGVEVTVGHEEEEGGRWPYAGTAGAIKALGAKHCVKEVTISFRPPMSASAGLCNHTSNLWFGISSGWELIINIVFHPRGITK